MNIPRLSKYRLSFPNPHNASEEGIVAWGGDLSPSRLILAYKEGIFPWYSKGDPIIWWSTNPRLILELNDFKISRSLKKSIKKFEYRFDANFKDVVSSCKSKKREGQDGTWIQDEVAEAYLTLHDMGIAHSVEAYLDDKLAGGLYGVVVGGVFCGESMFWHERDASKSAFAILVKHLIYWGYDFIDCQIPTEHLKSLGAKEVERDYFLKRLKKVNIQEINHRWNIEKNLI